MAKACAVTSAASYIGFKAKGSGKISDKEVGEGEAGLLKPVEVY